MEKQLIKDIQNFGHEKAEDIEKKLSKLEGHLLEAKEELSYIEFQLREKKSEVEDLEERIYFKKLKKSIYERISSVDSKQQYSKFLALLDEIVDSDNEMDYIDQLVAIKYDVEGKKCSHDFKCECK